MSRSTTVTCNAPHFRHANLSIYARGYFGVPIKRAWMSQTGLDVDDVIVFRPPAWLPPPESPVLVLS